MFPVAIHGSFGTKMPTLGQERYKDPFFFHMVCHPWETAGCVHGYHLWRRTEQISEAQSGFSRIWRGLDWLLVGPYGWAIFEKMGHYVPWLKKKTK